MKTGRLHYVIHNNLLADSLTSLHAQEVFLCAGLTGITESLQTPVELSRFTGFEGLQPSPAHFQDNTCRQTKPKEGTPSSLAKRSEQKDNCLPAFLQNYDSPVMINKPFQSGVMVNSPKKVNCCTGWNRKHSTSKTRMFYLRGHHAGTAKNLLEQRRPLATPTSVNNYCIG